MPVCLQIRHEPAGVWSITGLPHRETIEFADLARGLEYAKRACGAAAATIELFSDGLYIVVSQKEGWPHQLCRSSENRQKSLVLSMLASSVLGLSSRLHRYSNRVVQYCHQRHTRAGDAQVPELDARRQHRKS